jgi:hypothetical protein
VTSERRAAGASTLRSLTAAGEKNPWRVEPTRVKCSPRPLRLEVKMRPGNSPGAPYVADNCARLNMRARNSRRSETRVVQITINYARIAKNVNLVASGLHTCIRAHSENLSALRGANGRALRGRQV